MEEVSAQSQQGGKWTIYIGTVTEDKDPFSRDVKVHLTELLPFMTGEIKSVKDRKVLTNSDEISTTVDTTNDITAKYFDLNTNRRYPPDVRKNEQVLVVNYADSDQYYWVSSGRDDKLRQLERLNLSVAGSNTTEELTDENTYYVELDTLHNKHVVISTSKKNGEQFRYLFKIDADQSTIQLCDDDDNEILIESLIPRVRLRNHDGTILDLARKNLTMIVPEDLIIKVGRQTVFDIPALTFRNTSGDGTTHWTMKNVNIEGSDSIILKSPSIELDGAVHAKNIVSGHHQATGYSTGTDGGAYTGATVNLDNGHGSNPTNSPNLGGGDQHNRHCAAWEQIRQALRLIADCMDQVDCGSGGEVRALADSCKMELNRGE